MSTLSITAIPAFTDNYIWCIDNKSDAVIVDPGTAEPVLQHLKNNNLSLSKILVTHHHFDHVGGIADLKKVFPDAEVIGFRDAKIKSLETLVIEGDQVSALGLELSVIEVPGHTLDHIAYVTEIESTPRLFCGDTLFSAGCGRLFEGTPHQMYQSLKKIKSLPENTLVYCAHEYTLANTAFAKSLMPSNTTLLSYDNECIERRNNDLSTIPAVLSTELNINPFLRETDAEMIDNLHKLGYKELSKPEDVFAAARDAKNKA